MDAPLIVANHINMGQRNSDQGRFRKRSTTSRRHAQLCQNRLNTPARSGPTVGPLARVQLAATRAYRQSGRFDESIAAGREAASLYRGLLTDHPGQFEFEYGHSLQLAYQELAFAYMESGKAAKPSPVQRGAEDVKVDGGTSGCLVSRVVQIKNDLAMVDYNLKIATDTDTFRFAVPRREVIHESYEICDKLGFVQPLSVTLRRIYADGCLNVALFKNKMAANPTSLCYGNPNRCGKRLAAWSPRSFEARGFLVIVRRELMHARDGPGEP